MPARTPGDCDRLFEEHVNAGEVEGVVRNNVVRVVTAGEDLALVYNEWSMSAKGRDGKPIVRTGKAVEVVRRQADGTWRFAIDDP